MPRQIRHREINPIFGYLPRDLYADIEQDYLDVFDRYNRYRSGGWQLLGELLEDLLQPVFGILHLSLAIIVFPIAIALSIYNGSFDPILSFLCRIARGTVQLLTTLFVPFKIITRLVLMNYQEKFSADMIIADYAATFPEFSENVHGTRETLSLIEAECDEILKSSPDRIIVEAESVKTESKDVASVSQKKSQSDLFILVRLKNLYVGESKIHYSYQRLSRLAQEHGVPVNRSPISDQHIFFELLRLHTTYEDLTVRGHKSVKENPHDFFIESEIVIDYFSNRKRGVRPIYEQLIISKYRLHHAQAWLDNFIKRIKREELCEMVTTNEKKLPSSVIDIIAGYAPVECQTPFTLKKTEEYNNRERKYDPFHLPRRK